MKNPSYDVIELRRAAIAGGARTRFACHVESWLPDALAQLGAGVLGHFFERARPDGFACLRGFTDVAARKSANQALYGGPAWRDQQAQLDSLLDGAEDVLLLRPLYPDSGLPMLAAVDLLAEPYGAQGVVVAQILPLAAQPRAQLAAEQCFAGYGGRGVIEAGLLLSEDRRSLVWLGVLRDDAALAALRPVCEAAAASLHAAGHLTQPADWLVLDPAPRSRLRWMPVPARTQELAA